MTDATDYSNKPTPKELAALQAFAAEYGRKWKESLAFTYWYNARIWRDASGAQAMGYLLHGLRNRLGPRWLATFKLPRD